MWMEETRCRGCADGSHRRVLLLLLWWVFNARTVVRCRLLREARCFATPTATGYRWRIPSAERWVAPVAAPPHRVRQSARSGPVATPSGAPRGQRSHHP